MSTTPPETAPDVVGFYNRFFDVLIQVFPGIEHLHYGLSDTPAGGPLGRLARLRQGSERLLERVIETAGLRQLPAGARGLDVGCGLGGTMRRLASELGAHMTGANLNAAELRLAGERLAAAGLGERTTLVHADACALPLPERSFDFATLVEVGLHVEDKRALLSEVARVLAPGGRLVLVDQENSEAFSFAGLFFFPEVGTYRRLAVAAGLEPLTELDLSAPLAAWMDDYAATAAGLFARAAEAVAFCRGGPALCRRYRAAMRFYDQLVRAEVARRGLRPERRGQNGIQTLRLQTAACLRNGEARYGLLVARRP